MTCIYQQYRNKSINIYILKTVDYRVKREGILDYVLKYDMGNFKINSRNLKMLKKVLEIKN